MTTSKTPNPPAVSIDLGSARIKLGYYTDSGDFKLMRSGWGEKYMPATAVIDRDRDSTLLFGEAAEDALKDPGRHLSIPRAFVNIKDSFGSYVRRLFGILTLKPQEDPWIHTRAAHLKEMREMASAELAFGGQPPDVVYLAYSPLYSDKQREMLEAAATEAGFKTVHLVSEPIAVGQAFLGEEARNLSRDVLLVDCGGWSLDISYLDRKLLSPTSTLELKSLSFKVGGEKVDEALITRVRRAGNLTLKAPRPFKVVQLRVRELKEAFCANRLPEQCTIMVPRHDGHRAEQVPVVLKKTDFEDAIQEYITRVCSHVVKYLESQRRLVRELKNSGRKLSLVLVGGSSQVSELKDALPAQLNDVFGINSDLFPTSEFNAQYAVVKGALPVPAQHAPEAEPEHDSSGTPEAEPEHGSSGTPEAKPEHGSSGTSEDKTWSTSEPRPPSEPSGCGCILGLLAPLWLWFRNF